MPKSSLVNLNLEFEIENVKDENLVKKQVFFVDFFPQKISTRKFKIWTYIMIIKKIIRREEEIWLNFHS